MEILHSILDLLRYVPLLTLWICVFYLWALIKEPEIVADMLGTERDWLRRTLLTVLFLGFGISFFAGGAAILFHDDFFHRWNNMLQVLLIALPLMMGSVMASIVIVAAGMELANKKKEADIRRRCGVDP